MKSQWKCIKCGLLTTGRELPDGRVVADDGPPDLKQAAPYRSMCPHHCVEDTDYGDWRNHD